jgi:hypothetical protein
MSATANPELLTPHIRNNRPFLGTIVLLVLLPSVVTYFGPSIFPAFGDIHWMGIGWGIAIILMFVADENFVPGKNNLSSGVRQGDHLSHRLVTNPMFLAGLLLLVFLPSPLTYFGPVVITAGPEWIWLLLGWISAALGAYLMYSAMKTEEARVK